MNPAQMNPIQMVLNSMLQQKPQLQQNPMAQEMIQVIQSGDAKRGQEIADNLCRSYGVSREQALQQAQSTFFPQR